MIVFYFIPLAALILWPILSLTTAQEEPVRFPVADEYIQETFILDSTKIEYIDSILNGGE